jgi:hypothetical protein
MDLKKEGKKEIFTDSTLGVIYVLSNNVLRFSDPIPSLLKKLQIFFLKSSFIQRKTYVINLKTGLKKPQISKKTKPKKIFQKNLSL